MEDVSLKEGFANKIAELNGLACKSPDAGYYDIYLQTG
jgi:hypothetical protein